MPPRVIHRALWLLLLAGCSEPAVTQLARPFELHALTSRGEPLPRLRAWLDGTLLGETQAEGVLRGTLRGRVHQRVVLSWACPAAYEPPSEQRELSLDAAQTPLKLEARCAPLDIAAALVVRARGAPPEGLPIVVRDEVVARTDESGLAHVVLRARRGSALTVGLDTTAHPGLVPASPLETFQLGREDTILLLDRTLALPPKSKPARVVKPKGPSPRKPIRIQ